MTLFTPKAYHLHHQRAKKSFHNHNFLYAHVEGELQTRLQDFRKSFHTTLGLAAYPLPYTSTQGSLFDIPFQEASFDLIVSCLQAHWVEDLPGLLRRMHGALQEEGLFLGALLGGQTLFELRECLLQAELELTGKVAPRLSPMLHPADAPRLLSHASFFMPVVDTEKVVVTYASLFSLMKDLRGMGETNKLSDRPKGFAPRKLFSRTEEIYLTRFGTKEGLIPATFEVLYLTGWRKTTSFAGAQS